MKRLLPLILLALAFYFSSCKKPTLFQQVSSSHSGIHFNNQITENDSINPLDIVNVYNGGGIGVGDFNNDGLQDLYFVGNTVPNKLYINKGDFKFEDVTDKAGVGGMGRWGRGVSIIDINNDGLMDIYVCNTIYKDSTRRRNLLYINQGADKDGVPHFKEMAAEYGLDANVQSTMSTFFDYDNDGNLDMYLTVNEANASNTIPIRSAFGPRGKVPNRYGKAVTIMIGMPSLKHPVFHDVSLKAGINLPRFWACSHYCRHQPRRMERHLCK